MAKSKVEEYKDRSHHNRIRIRAENGEVTYVSHEGFKNKKDMRDNAINAALDILEKYANDLSEDQEGRLFDIAGKIIEKGR